MTPFSPRISTAAPAVVIFERRFFSSVITAERPKLAMLSGIAARDSPARSARFTVASSFCSAIGFSRKSIAPMRVASTAVSIVPWPDIMITGMLSCPPVAHSLRSVMPSASGIQMSRSTRSGLPRARSERAAVAFSAT
jgi:hypothetical protein